MERKLTSQQIGGALNVSAASVQRYAREGRIPFATTPGGQRRFNLDEVLSALGEMPKVRVTAPRRASGAMRIGTGEPARRSRADALAGSVRAVTPAAADTTTAAGRVVHELVASARRVLLAR